MLSRVEKYEIVEEIGHGGMATVYRARDVRLQREVALKVMHPHLQGAKEARQRFAREALTVAKLHHPGILEIYDYSGEDSEVAFIATELLTGPTLKQFVEAHPTVPPEIAACMVLQVAQALAVAHGAGVVHRDVKPENVMLHRGGVLKLTDFGIAQLLDAQSMTTTGQVLGSPGHMAPEQIEGKECDPRTDLFSLGTVLYLLTTGELPFTGKNPHQVLKRIMEGRYADPLLVRASIGAPLARIIARCLELDPDKRYQTADQLEADLLALLCDMEVDSPDELLVEYLADPEAFAQAFRPRIIARLTVLGERAQRRGRVPEAFEHYNRVLSLDETNAHVLSAVQGLGRRSALRRVGASVAGVAVLLGLGVFAISALGEQRHGPRLVKLGERTVASSRVVLARVPEAKAVTPKQADTQPPLRTKKREWVPRPPPHGPRRVTFKPYPANVAIGINGAPPRDFGPSFRDVELEPGVHRFKFVGGHDCCIDEEVSVKIPPGEGTFTVSQRLKFKQAGLYVVTKTPANVVVDDGKVSGRTHAVIEVPDMDSMVETHTIRVSAEGLDDHVEQVKLRAGKVVTVQVAMQPSAGAPKVVVEGS